MTTSSELRRMLLPGYVEKAGPLNQWQIANAARRYPSVEERFWPRVRKGEGDACWEWIGNLHNSGYGWFNVCGRGHLSHRVSWALHNGPIQPGMLVCHHCDNRPCVNPAHFFLGTAADNAQDMSRKNRSPVHAHPEIVRCGEDNPFAKLTASQVIEIRTRRAAGETQAALGRAFGVEPSNIYMIATRKTWRHLP